HGDLAFPSAQRIDHDQAHPVPGQEAGHTKGIGGVARHLAVEVGQSTVAPTWNRQVPDRFRSRDIVGCKHPGCDGRIKRHRRGPEPSWRTTAAVFAQGRDRMHGVLCQSWWNWLPAPGFCVGDDGSAAKVTWYKPVSLLE